MRRVRPLVLVPGDRFREDALRGLGRRESREGRFATKRRSVAAGDDRAFSRRPWRRQPPREMQQRHRIDLEISISTCGSISMKLPKAPPKPLASTGQHRHFVSTEREAIAAPVPGPTPVTTATAALLVIVLSWLLVYAESACVSAARCHRRGIPIRSGSPHCRRRVSVPSCGLPTACGRSAPLGAAGELFRTWSLSCSSRIRFSRTWGSLRSSNRLSTGADGTSLASSRGKYFVRGPFLEFGGRDFPAFHRVDRSIACGLEARIIDQILAIECAAHPGPLVIG